MRGREGGVRDDDDKIEVRREIGWWVGRTGLLDERLEINEQRRVATTSARGCCCSRSVVRFVSFWP